MKKIHFTFDKNSKSQKLKKIILKKYVNFSPSKSDLIIVAGGDGYMLSVLKKYYKYKKPFYGINCGTYGFLMNKYNYKNLYKKINRSKKTTINPLVLITDIKNKVKKKIIAINEVSLFRQSRQTALLNLKIGKKTIIKKLIGDGVLVSTPAGSTAYNLSVHGPILSLNSKKLAVTPISPFRPRRWKGKTVSDKSKIIIKNLSPQKRPVAVTADNFEIRNIKSLSVKIDKSIKINLLYDKDRTLTKRIKIEQLRKNTK
jgi:NAD+ kinase